MRLDVPTRKDTPLSGASTMPAFFMPIILPKNHICIPKVSVSPLYIEKQTDRSIFFHNSHILFRKKLAELFYSFYLWPVKL